MEQKEKRPFVDILINILYVMAMSMDRMVRVVEILLRARGQTWQREKKQRFTEMIKAIERIKKINDLIDLEDYGSALVGREHIYQYYQEDAYKLCREIIFFCDRDAEDQNNSYETFKLMRSQKGTGNIGEREMEWFYLKK